jgi:Fe-S cluster biogenesis protein NfuA
MDDFQGRLRRAEELIADLERLLDPVARARVQDLVALLLQLHAEGLRRLLGRVGRETPRAREFVEDAARDEVVGGLLLLHGLHPQDLESRIRGALDRVRPQLASHGGNVEMLQIDAGGVLHLRLEGSCHGCPSSEATLRTTIESAVREAAPDVADLVLETAAPEAKAGVP